MKAVNLLPPDLRGAAKPATAIGAGDEPAGRIGAFAVIGALAFCVLALAAYVLTGNTVKDRQAQLDQVSAEAATAAQQAARLKPYADFAAQEQERIQTVKDLASARFDWEQALRDVSRAVPAAVTLSNLNGTISTSGGSGGNPLRSAIPSPAIEMQGCTTGGQSDVATLLSRLRAVDGVTRVSLQSSQRPAPGSPSTASTTPTTGSAAGCGKGRPAQFNLVIFFEHSTVPATVDDVSGAAASSTATSSGSTASGSGTSSASGSSATSTPTSTTSTP